MFDRGNKEENGKKKGYGFPDLQVLEQLEKEIQLLNDEKENLLDIERVLLFLMNRKIDDSMKKNQELRVEVEKQKANCLKLESVLNASIKASYSIP